MWSFPLVSLFFGYMTYRKKNLNMVSGSLLLGLALQMFAYSYFPFELNEKLSLIFVTFGKSLALSFLIASYSGIDFTGSEAKERIRLKLIPLVGLIFITIHNLIGQKEAEALLSILLIVFPAVFWRKIREKDHYQIFALFLISFFAFSSFILQWSNQLLDTFNLIPLLWMLSFTCCLYLFYRNSEES